MTSDGCTSVLGAWMARQWPAALAVCYEHDADYRKGGDERDRLIADLKFFIGLLRVPDMPPLVAQQAYSTVRLFGVLYWTGTDDGSLVVIPDVEIIQTA